MKLDVSTDEVYETYASMPLTHVRYLHLYTYNIIMQA